MSKKIIVYCGQSVEDKCRQQFHPVKEVEIAKDLVNSSKHAITYSNSPDFVSAVKYIAEKQGIEAEFFLNGVSCGNDIEPIFEDFNRALDMIRELSTTEK
jgi:hypothetical protein